MGNIRRFWAATWRSYSIGVVAVVVAMVLTLITPNFLTTANLLNVLTNACVVAIVGLGMTLAIAGGMFDLSVGSTAAFASCITLSLVAAGQPVWLSVVAGLLTGAAVGLVNGLVITELRVPAFIGTLAMQQIVRGLALIYTNGRDIYLYGRPDFKVMSGDTFGIPTPVLMAFGLALVLALMVAHTRFGRHILAVGSNLNTARRSGVATSRVIWGIFALVGATAALTGLVVSAQVLTANARLNVGLELSAIAVVVIGGTPLTGGRASLVGTLLGSILIAMINTGLNLLNVPIFYQSLTVGILLVLALAVSVERGGFKLSTLFRRLA
jgi:ribose/xylose/arabinose/galactoside ABC-type transport system permease subunit